MNEKIKDILREKSGPEFFAIDFGATLAFGAVPTYIAMEVFKLDMGNLALIILSGFALSRIVMSAVIKKTLEE